jgi:general secretion pathway protein L
MPQRIIGIDVGSYSVKVAEVERSFKSFHFTHFFERRIQYNELLSREESVAIALQGIIDDNDLHWDIASVGMPGQRVSSRVLTFPFGGAKRIEQTVAFEMEGFIPFDVDEVVIDHAVVWSSKEASKVLVLYVQNAEVAKHLSMLQNVGIDPRFVCVEGVELINLVNLGMVPPEGAYAIIDLGHEKTTISICQGKQIAYVRAVSIAGKTITEAIAKELELPYDEAEKIKIDMGNLPLSTSEPMDDLSKQVVGAIRKVTNELLLHLRQTVFTYRDTEGIPVEGVFLSGGTSRLPGLDRAISDSLKQNVAFIDPREFHFTKLEGGEGHSRIMPQALSLALRGMGAGSDHDVNFRKGDFAFTGDVRQLGGSVRRVFIVLGLIVALALGNFTLKYYSLKKRLGKVQTDVASLVTQVMPNAPKRSLKTTTMALSLIKGKETEARDRIDKLNATMGLSPLDVLKEISKVLPARDAIKIDVNNISVTQERATFSGQTDSFESVDRIKKALEGSTMLRNVTTGNVRKGVKGEIKFDVGMEVGTEEEEV